MNDFTGFPPLAYLAQFFASQPGGAANQNVSQAEVKAMLPPPLSRAERDWQNYGRRMSPDDVLGSEPVWSWANLYQQQGLGRAEGFADAANDFWQRMGANRYITPEQARRHMAVEEAKMRGIGAVKAAPMRVMPLETHGPMHERGALPPGPMPFE